jgi:hypothetical protein
VSCNQLSLSRARINPTLNGSWTETNVCLESTPTCQYTQRYTPKRRQGDKSHERTRYPQGCPETRTSAKSEGKSLPTTSKQNPNKNRLLSHPPGFNYALSHHSIAKPTQRPPSPRLKDTIELKSHFCYRPSHHFQRLALNLSILMPKKDHIVSR